MAARRGRRSPCGRGGQDMADEKGDKDADPEISGFDTVFIGYNYISLGLSLLKIEAAVAGSAEVMAGTTMEVFIGGDYTTKMFGAAANVWFPIGFTYDYASRDTNETGVEALAGLKSAVVEHGNVSARVHSAALSLFARGAEQARDGTRTEAQAVRIQNQALATNLGGQTSTAGTS